MSLPDVFDNRLWDPKGYCQMVPRPVNVRAYQPVMSAFSSSCSIAARSLAWVRRGLIHKTIGHCVLVRAPDRPFPGCTPHRAKDGQFRSHVDLACWRTGLDLRDLLDRVNRLIPATLQSMQKGVHVVAPASGLAHIEEAPGSKANVRPDPSRETPCSKETCPKFQGKIVTIVCSEIRPRTNINSQYSKYFLNSHRMTHSIIKKIKS